jgi:hypothetical protein
MCCRGSNWQILPAVFHNLNTAGSMRRQQCAGSIGRSCPQKQPAPARGVLQWLDDEYRFLTPPKVRSRPPPGYCRAVRSAAS